MRRLFKGTSFTGARAASLNTQSPLSYGPSNLPSETLFLLDGTAMLFYAYYSNASRTKYRDAAFTADFSKTWMAKQSIHVQNRFKEASLLQLESLKAEGSLPAIEPSQLSCSALSTMMHNFAYFINQFQPSYLAVAFDSRPPTFRKKIFAEYKSQRKQTPVELLPQMEMAPTIFESLGCKCFQMDGYEADDIMATLGTWGRERYCTYPSIVFVLIAHCSYRGLNVVHVSLDKDMLQLIDVGVHILDPRTNKIIGEQDVVERYGVLPSQICDLFALIGDEVDNIPGVKKFGPVTSKYLLQHYKTIENLYQSLGFDQIQLPSEVSLLMNDLNNKESQKLLLSHLKQSISTENYDRLITKFQELCKYYGIRKKPESLLLPLYGTSYETVKLYKHLIQLKKNLPLEYFIPSSSTPQTTVLKEKRTISHVSDSEVLEVREEAQIVSSSSSPVRQPLQSTNDLRYKGERKFQQKQLEEHLIQALSESFSAPLQYLRQSYHKLDRN